MKLNVLSEVGKIISYGIVHTQRLVTSCLGEKSGHNSQVAPRSTPSGLQVLLNKDETEYDMIHFQE